MPNTSSISRILALMQWLSIPGSQRTVRELAAHFETSEKTIRRDIEELRSHGIQIHETSGSNNRKAYSMPRDELPPLRLTFDEALAVFLGRSSMNVFARTGLEQAADNAFQKLRTTLGEAESQYVDKLAKRIHFLQCDSTIASDRTVVDDLLVAIEDSRAIFIEYLSASSTEPLTYDIYPYGMAEHRDSLYVVGFSCHHSEIRTWKVDRILSTELTLFPFKLPADFEFARFFDGAFAVVSGKSNQTVRVRIEGTAVRYVTEKQFHASQINEMQNDGSVLVTFTLTSLMEIRSWVLSFGSKAEVLEPAELRNAIGDEIEKLSQRYQGRSVMEKRQDSSSHPIKE